MNTQDISTHNVDQQLLIRELYLNPIYDIGKQAMRERDEWNRWSVGISRLLNVSCCDFRSDIVAEQYAELRERITQALSGSPNEKSQQPT
jgi:hypothetical protein